MISERVRVHVGLAAAVLVLVVCLALLISGTLHRGDSRAALPGTVAPDFALRDAEDNPVELSDLRGNVVIVYFHGHDSDHAVAGPTSAPSDSDSTASLEHHDGAVVSGTKLQTVSATSGSPELSQLSAMCRKLHNPRVKVLDLENPASLVSSGTLSFSPETVDNPVRTLLDPTGDVAREYRIDRADSKPTFFVIDPSGIIRYRGNGDPTTGQLLSPATQPSSCPQVVQTLLNSEAINVAMRP